jgi:transcriptional regulator with XRE-family HTH domain
MLKMPTGRQIAAARMMAGLHQQELAKLAHLDVTTVNRMEGMGAEQVRSLSHNVQRVLDALARKGVEIRDDGSVGPVTKVRR